MGNYIRNENKDVNTESKQLIFFPFSGMQFPLCLSILEVMGGFGRSPWQEYNTHSCWLLAGKSAQWKTPETDTRCFRFPSYCTNETSRSIRCLCVLGRSGVERETLALGGGLAHSDALTHLEGLGSNGRRDLFPSWRMGEAKCGNWIRSGRKGRVPQRCHCTGPLWPSLASQIALRVRALPTRPLAPHGRWWWADHVGDKHRN